MAMDEHSYDVLLDDVRMEAQELIDVLSGLTAEQWRLPTPARGWDIHDQAVHLAFFDDLAGLAFTDPAEFGRRSATVMASGQDWVDLISHSRRDIDQHQLVAWFEQARTQLLRVLADVGPTARCEWLGPPMSAASSATARLMETWAHAQDCYDTLGRPHPPTDRISHVCRLGVVTRRFAYQLNGLPAPADDVRVELVAQDGSLLTWGPADATGRISGSATDFALVVTQRRHPADTDLRASAGAAAHWLTIAQAYAGKPGGGRAPKR